MGFFLQDLVYLRLIFKSPQHYIKSRLLFKHPSTKSSIEKIIINHFQNQIFDAKTRNPKEFYKNINY